jgi:hypothetical protein
MLYPRAHSFTKTLTFGAADTVKSEALQADGQLMQLHVRVPNFTNAVTAAVTLETSAGYVLWSSATDYGALAKNANHNLLLEELLPCEAPLTLKVTLSGAPGGSGGDVVLVGRHYGI